MQEDIIGKFKKIVRKKCPNCNNYKIELREILKNKTIYGKEGQVRENIYHCPKCDDIWSAEYKVCKQKSVKWIGGVDN